MKRLILGLGNEILTDDGIGLKIVSDLQKTNTEPGLDFRTSALGGLELLDIIRDYDEVIIVDAMKTGQVPPGTVQTFVPEDFRDTLHLSNLHDIGFLTALELGKRTGLEIPCSIRIIGVEIIEDQVFSEKFSPVITRMYPDIIAKASHLVRCFLGLNIPGYHPV
jgi:hydrogenase maturation protease